MAKYRKLGRTSDQRKAVTEIRLQICYIMEKSVTTETKAKEIRKIAEVLSLWQYVKKTTLRL